MKVYIETEGDHTVGIFPAEVTVDFGEGFDIDNYNEYREDTRISLSEAFHEILDNKVSVRFEDECPDCGTKLKGGKCEYRGCISYGH